MYTERLLDHFRDPHGVGDLEAPAVTVEVENPACGDLMRLAARFENGVVSDARYRAKGCTASIAAGSALVDWLAGRSAAELAAFQAESIDEALGGLAPASKHAAVLCTDAVRALLRASKSK
ncbi:MAG TPA: iron-sulfur cluster assembly scaffold protein [Bryobacteraceae bacterium]|nr:iron-sulfur cluster assembly scaffold protein [Bryobacteraceae bacterium]